MAKATASSTKPRVNVGTIGPSGHGKTALTAAILKVQAKSNLAEAVSYDDIQNYINDSVEYETQSRRYTHVDCAGGAAYLKDLITGVTQMDGVILVVAVSDGVMAQTREYVLLARQLGLAHVVVFLNKCDGVDDDGVLDMVEMEVRELLTKHQFNGDSAPVIRGSAQRALDGAAEWEASIGKLLDSLDSYIPEPVRDLGKPFRMAISDVSSTQGSDTTASGQIERGVIKIGDEVEIVGSKGARKTVVTGIEMSGSPIAQGQAGDQIDCLLRGIGKDEIECGQVLAKPGSITPRAKFEGEVYVLKKEEGGRREPFTTSYRPQVYIHAADVMGTVNLPDGVMMVMPGDNITMTIQLDAPVALEEQMYFALCEKNDDDDDDDDDGDDDDDTQIVGVGVVTKILA